MSLLWMMTQRITARAKHADSPRPRDTTRSALARSAHSTNHHSQTPTQARATPISPPSKGATLSLLWMMTTRISARAKTSEPWSASSKWNGGAALASD